MKETKTDKLTRAIMGAAHDFTQTEYGSRDSHKKWRDFMNSIRALARHSNSMEPRVET